MIEIDNIIEVEKKLEGIDAVIFDLDDTLYSEKEYVWSGYRAIATIFPDVSDMEYKLWAVFKRRGKAIDEVLASEGLLLKENKNNALTAYRFQKPDICLYNGVPEMLKRIRKTRKIGIITDGRSEGQRAKIKALKIMEYVDEIIVTDELGGIEYRKPNSVAFEIMQRKLEIPFERMAYVGDNIHKDFVAPGKLGMREIWFKNRDGLYFEE